MIKPSIENTQHGINELYDTFSELSAKDKTLSLKEKELSKNMFSEQVRTVLDKTYLALQAINEKYILNEQIVKFENNINSVDKYIDYYQNLINEVSDNEDENILWRYEFSIGTYKSFKKKPDEALQTLRMMIVANLFLEDIKFYNFSMSFLKKHNPKEYTSANKNFVNKDLFINLYNQLEGYKITHKKIVKSAALKIFNFFEIITKVQKKSLADKIEHIFIALGEDISIDSKRASSIKIIGQYKDITLLDYLSNKKSTLYDFGLFDIFTTQISSMIKQLKKNNDNVMIKRINKNIQLYEATLIQQILT